MSCPGVGILAVEDSFFVAATGRWTLARFLYTRYSITTIGELLQENPSEGSCTYDASDTCFEQTNAPKNKRDCFATAVMAWAVEKKTHTHTHTAALPLVVGSYIGGRRYQEKKKLKRYPGGCKTTDDAREIVYKIANIATMFNLLLSGDDCVMGKVAWLLGRELRATRPYYGGPY